MNACRLFVIVARDAPVAAILRRGPSAWFHLIRWDMERDQFDHGAWFKGRIYEDRCDLSPDGELFVSFCHQGSRLGTSYSDSWTAVSRLPWLHALALWPQGTTYGGGGRFVGKRELMLRDERTKTHPDHPATGLTITTGNPARQSSSEEVEQADWSGRDHLGRIIYCRAGKLFRRDPRRGDIELGDFDDLSPHPTPPPDGARQPLVRSPK